MSYESYLAHHGIKGMRWGVRRYQNADGSLTGAGQKRYGLIDKAKKAINESMETRRYRAERNKIRSDHYRKNYEAEVNKVKAREDIARAIQRNTKEGGVVHKISKDAGDSYLRERLDKEYNFDLKSKAYADKKIINKYGQETMDRINRQESREAMAACAAILSVAGAYGVAHLMGKI